jgi:hypothetical protein
MRRVIASLIVTGLLALGIAGCSSDADVASKNLSKDADNFKIDRRIIFYNGITGDYILTIEGFCSVNNDDIHKLTVTCKIGDTYKKDYLGTSDNVTWFAEQLEGKGVSTNHYQVNFKPSVIVPDVNTN